MKTNFEFHGNPISLQQGKIKLQIRSRIWILLLPLRIWNRLDTLFVLYDQKNIKYLHVVVLLKFTKKLN
jgi:hypothetical protein